MKLAVYCSNYPPHPGGLEAVVSNIANGLAERHDVVLVTTAWDRRVGLSNEGRLVVLRLPAVHRTEGWGVPYPVPLAGFRRAWQMTCDADIIHAHGALYAPSLMAARLARATGTPLVLTEHVGFVHYRRPALNRIQRLAWKSVGSYVLGSANAVTVYNARVERWFAEEHEDTPVVFVGNGVDHERFRPRGSEERTQLRKRLGFPAHDVIALFVGREAEKKNLDSVLRIPRSNFVLAICGARRGLKGDRLIDLGVVPHDDMPDVYGAVDLMVHASTGEGFPLAMQEAMAAGLPLAVLWDEGYARTLDPAVVEPVDSLANLAAAVQRLAADTEMRRGLGTRAMEWARAHWRWSHTVEAYDKLFEKLAAGRTLTTKDVA